MKIRFEPRDLWIGIYWTINNLNCSDGKYLYIYICIIPCFPIIFGKKLE